MLGTTSSIKRTPSPEVARAAIEAGIGIHFSGHLHVNDTARTTYGGKTLVNIGVPSLVAFPPAFKVLTIGEDRLGIEAVSLDSLPIDPAINSQYRIEIDLTGKQVGRMLEAADYGAFLCAHVDQLIIHRYLKRDWPADLARVMPLLKLGDLFLLGQCKQSIAIEDVIETTKAARAHNREMDSKLRELDGISVLELLGDWYRLRMGSEMALDYIPPQRLAAYRVLIDIYAQEGTAETAGAAQKFALLLRMMAAYLSGLPSRNFSVDFETGAIVQT